MRVGNDRIARRAGRLGMDRYPLICECRDPGCREIFLVSADDYLVARRLGRAVAKPAHRL